MVQFKKKEAGSDNFRDQLATIDEKGNRVWVYARKTKGKFTTARNIVGIFLLALFFTGPFLTINGQPLLLLNFIERRIVIFGVQFWPQDFHLFFLAMIALMVFIILFTVVYGRLFCGWVCPQTIFMELVFRRIEYWIEGDAWKQKRLDKGPWNFNKLWRRALKHTLFFLFSLIVTNFFLMYIIGVQDWKGWITENPFNHAGGTAGMLIFAGVFYFVFSWFREQVCTIVCPYGRLQGVLLDRQSVVISYDYHRGEPRGIFRMAEDRDKAGKGACINCHMCVSVCPTGIDIRNGTQLECINCANCIDACNSQMKATGQKPGLIRYASEKMIADRASWKPTFRAIAYSIVLLILLSVVTYAMTARSAIEATVLRAPGQLFQEQGNGAISNLYNIKLINKTNEEMPIELKLISPEGTIKVIGGPITVKAQSVGESVFFIIIGKSLLKNEKTGVEVGVFSSGELIDVDKVSFISPKN